MTPNIYTNPSEESRNEQHNPNVKQLEAASRMICAVKQTKDSSFERILVSDGRAFFRIVRLAMDWSSIDK